MRRRHFLALPASALAQPAPAPLWVPALPVPKAADLAIIPLTSLR